MKKRTFQAITTCTASTFLATTLWLTPGCSGDGASTGEEGVQLSVSLVEPGGDVVKDLYRWQGRLEDSGIPELAFHADGAAELSHDPAVGLGARELRVPLNTGKTLFARQEGGVFYPEVDENDGKGRVPLPMTFSFPEPGRVRYQRNPFVGDDLIGETLDVEAFMRGELAVELERQGQLKIHHEDGVVRGELIDRHEETPTDLQAAIPMKQLVDPAAQENVLEQRITGLDDEQAAAAAFRLALYTSAVKYIDHGALPCLPAKVVAALAIVVIIAILAVAVWYAMCYGPWDRCEKLMTSKGLGYNFDCTGVGVSYNGGTGEWHVGFGSFSISCVPVAVPGTALAGTQAVACACDNGADTGLCTEAVPCTMDKDCLCDALCGRPGVDSTYTAGNFITGACKGPDDIFGECIAGGGGGAGI